MNKSDITFSYTVALLFDFPSLYLIYNLHIQCNRVVGKGMSQRLDIQNSFTHSKSVVWPIFLLL